MVAFENQPARATVALRAVRKRQDGMGKNTLENAKQTIMVASRMYYQVLNISLLNSTLKYRYLWQFVLSELQSIKFGLRFFMHPVNQSRRKTPRSSVGGIVRLREKSQKNARNSLHSITIGSSTLGSVQCLKLK